MKSIFIILGAIVSCVWLVLAWEINRYAGLDETRPADAAIVLGAGVWRGQPSPVFRERIKQGVSLYEQGVVTHLIFTGGVGNRDTLSEAAVGRQYAIEQGVPAGVILVEGTSTSTIENLQNAQGVAAENRLDTFLLVSTPFHMKRAMQIAADLEMTAYTAPTRTIQWISPLTKGRALIQETVSYTRYMLFTRSEVVGNENES